MLHTAINFIVQTVQNWGYWGVFILTLLESTVAPVPSELILIPAGYLAFQGKMSLPLILGCAMLGGLTGASINYAFALWVGRPFLERWGKYFFVQAALLHKTDRFFRDYGAVSTFTGRLIPGIRHLISLPAGLTRMNVFSFAFYTLLGIGLWALVLTLIGYSIGNNTALIQEYLHRITLGVILGSVFMFALYALWRRHLAQREAIKQLKRQAQHQKQSGKPL
ncbi:MAG: DedA family protein [Betaproteobacteria bacterium]|nr:DedA family protein [Betaproteobacteria bacterium]